MLYENEIDGDKKVPFRYENDVKIQEPNSLTQLDNVNFCNDGRSYQVGPSSLHGVGLFSMDGVNVPYKAQLNSWSMLAQHTIINVGYGWPSIYQVCKDTKFVPIIKKMKEK